MEVTAVEVCGSRDDKGLNSNMVHNIYEGVQAKGTLIKNRGGRGHEWQGHIVYA
jgi:hypothetical protein